MAKELLKNLKNYFSYLEKLDEKYKELRSEVEEPLQALTNLSEQLRLVIKEENDASELFTIEDLREKLIFKILLSLENEMTSISEIVTKLHNAKESLKNKLLILERVRSQMSSEDLNEAEILNNTVLRPKLNLLLEWAADSYEYYYELYLLISNNLENIDYKNEESLNDFRRSFVEDIFKRNKINEILEFTQYLVTDAM